MGSIGIFLEVGNFERFSHFVMRHLTVNACCRPIHPVHGKLHSSLLSFSGFCNMSESPELPDWVKNPRDGGTYDMNKEDDFVLPTRLGSLNDQFYSRGVCDFRGDFRYACGDEIVDYDVNEISRVLKSRLLSPKAVIQALCGCNVNVSKSLVDKILNRFCNDWVVAFGFFKWASMQRGYKHSADSYDKMVDIVGKLKQFDIMWILVEEMLCFGDLISLTTMSKIMRRLAGARRWRDATNTFHEIEHFGLSKDTAAMNILLDTLCKERCVEHARDAFLELRSQICPDASTFNILIQGWCKARQMDEALQTMEEMRSFGFHPCALSYTTLLQAYCMDKNFRKVNAILDEMRTRGCPPNIVTYTIVMHSLGKAKETQEALDVYEKTRMDGCTPDTPFYNSLIYILGDAGRLQDAYGIYREMLKCGISPNVTTYHTMISAACDHSQEETALQLLQKMEENSCKPDLKTYTPLLKMCCRRKRMKLLSYLLNDMFRKDISLEFGTYTLLVNGLCRNGKLEQSCIFFEEMIFKGFLPWKNTYGMLMKELERRNMVKARERIQQLMVQAESSQRI